MAFNPYTRDFVTSKLPPLIGCVLLIYFAFHLLQGEKGILAYLSTQGSLHSLERQKEIQDAELKEMEDKVARLRPATFDKDFAEEQARDKAGLMRSDETLVILDEPGK